MLREFKKHDWLQLLRIPENWIPKVLVLRGTRDLKRHYTDFRERFTRVMDLGSSGGFVDDVFIGELNGHPVGYASVYGAPMASEIVHIFGSLGSQLVIQTGCCGGIADNLSVGDLFIATSAYCGDGTSQYYDLGRSIVQSTFSFEEAKMTMNKNTCRLYCGQIYTTAALLAEGEREIAEWRSLGCAAVDMETSASFSVAKYFAMDRGSILYVSDHLSRGENLLFNDEEKRDVLDFANNLMIDITLQSVAKYQESTKHRERH